MTGDLTSEAGDGTGYCSFIRKQKGIRGLLRGVKGDLGRFRKRGIRLGIFCIVLVRMSPKISDDVICMGGHTLWDILG